MLNEVYLREVMTQALTEDAPYGDITSRTLISEDAHGTIRIVARESGVMAAAELLPFAFVDCDVLEVMLDGTTFDAGDTLAVVSGPIRSILLGERVALNFAQRLCGIATLTSRYVEAVAGTHARIVDTRKTTPGLRLLEKHAVVCGNGYNHRFSLSDAVLVKDNHVAALSAQGLSLTEALINMRATIPHTMRIEVEVDRIDQIAQVLASGVVDTIMLDNFSLEDLAKGVAIVNGRALVEASGGVDLATVRAIAETGVDLISVGALTHGAPALDIGLDFVE